MGIKSTIRGGLAGIKRAINPPLGNGPAIDPIIADSEKPMNYKYNQPADNDYTPPHGIERPKGFTKRDYKQPAGYGSPKQRDPLIDPLSLREYEYNSSKYGKNFKQPDGYVPPKPTSFEEPDKADPQGLKRPPKDKSRVSMSEPEARVPNSEPEARVPNSKPFEDTKKNKDK